MHAYSYNYNNKSKINLLNYYYYNTYELGNLVSGVTRLLLMPGQRLGKPPTHAAHIHMFIFIWTSVFFSKYVLIAILYARCLS